MVIIDNKHDCQTSPVRGTGRGTAADALSPQVALLSNGSYGVMITDAGSGASTWRGLDVTRWREDATRDCWGQFVYVRGLEDGRIWSIGHQPLAQAVDEYQVAFHADRAEFRRRDGDVETRWAICVARDHDAEVRLITLVNHGDQARELELTSYAEVCLNNRRADQGHPAFAKLFLETEFVPGPGALLARRRPRAADEKPVWADPRHRGGRPSRWRDGIRDRPSPLSGPRPHARQPRGPGSRGTPVTGPPARCWTRYSVCGGGSASSREAVPASRSSPEPPTPGKRPSPWPSTFGTFDAVERAFAGARERLPARVVGAGPDPG